MPLPFNPVWFALVPAGLGVLLAVVGLTVAAREAGRLSVRLEALQVLPVQTQLANLQIQGERLALAARQIAPLRERSAIALASLRASAETLRLRQACQGLATAWAATRLLLRELD